MTLTYLRGGLSTCYVLCVSFPYFFVKFINILMQLWRHFFQNFKKYGSYHLFPEPFTLAQPLLWSLLLLRLSATLDFSLKMTISHVASSIFSDLTY